MKNSQHACSEWPREAGGCHRHLLDGPQGGGNIGAALWVPLDGHIGLAAVVDQVQEGQHNSARLVAVFCWEAEAVGVQLHAMQTALSHLG